jgi:putative ABC transport system substrate-binding protein
MSWLRLLPLLLLPVLLAAPVPAAHTAERVFRLAELAPSEFSLELTRKSTLHELAKLGFETGRNLVIEERISNASMVRSLARELLKTEPDAVLAIGSDAVKAAVEATREVPVVIFGSLPRGEHAPASLARPQGNVTGVVILGAELDGKRLDLLREAVPQARRIAALLMPSAPYRDETESEMRKVAAASGIELLVFDAARPEDYPAAFAAMRAAGAQALIIMAHANFNRDVVELTRLARADGLPTVCEWAQMAHLGCMLGYGPSREELRRRVAYQLAQIFKGTPPGELPIEQPTRYEFAINLNTAKALGIAIPTALLVRADQVIE